MDIDEWIAKRKVILDKVVERLDICDLLQELHDLDIAFIKHLPKR